LDIHTKRRVDKLQEELVSKPQWVIDGNHERTMDIRMQRMDNHI
jgi:hypothetical protein